MNLLDRRISGLWFMVNRLMVNRLMVNWLMVSRI